jgi:hypothetical protein
VSVDRFTIAEAAARCGLPESTLDMRTYLAGARRADEAAGEQRALFEAHARRLADAMNALELRRQYLDLKVQYWSAQGHRMTTIRVTSPFDFSSTAADVIAGIDLHGRRALVTGAASGIGIETREAWPRPAPRRSSRPATWRPPSELPPTSGPRRATGT